MSLSAMDGNSAITILRCQSEKNTYSGLDQVVTRGKEIV